MADRGISVGESLLAHGDLLLRHETRSPGEAEAGLGQSVSS